MSEIGSHSGKRLAEMPASTASPQRPLLKTIESPSVRPRQPESPGGKTHEELRAEVRKALPALLIVYVLGDLMLQAFNLVYQNIGNSLNMRSAAPLLSTIPGVALAVLTLLYDSLCDFISPRRMTLIGVSAMIVGSVLGFLVSGSFWVILISRILQVVGSQVSGSVYLVLVTKYTRKNEKTVYVGIFGAMYYFACVVGILAGGLIVMIPWRFLFLVPALALFCMPVLIKDIPDIEGQAEHTDYFGMAVFAAIPALVVIYFNYKNWAYLVAIAVLVAVFCVYVMRGKHPFLTRRMAGNRSFVITALIIVVFNLFNYAVLPIYEVIGSGVYHISLLTVSLYLAIVYVLSAFVGVVSGKIVNLMGRWRAIFWSGVLRVAGFALSALFIRSGFWLLTIFGCLYSFGCMGAYSSLYNCATDALPIYERGRGIGVAETARNTTTPVGMALYSMMLALPQLQQRGFGVGLHAASDTQTATAAANLTSNIFWIMAISSLVALAMIVVFRKQLIGGDKRH